MTKLKIPTKEDYKNFDGRSCFRIWQMLDEDWRCPGCGRTKFKIMRWTKIVDLKHRGPDKRYIMGWSANLHRHHDHWQCEYADFGQGRFPETIVCCDCNSADASAKRKLNLPRSFSFSPYEISQFVIAVPHGKHKINYEKALQIFESSYFGNNT